MDQQPPDTPDDPLPKLLGPIRLKLRVAAISAAVLATGAMLAPPSTPSAVPASQERPVPLLEAELERREPIRVFRPIRDVAARVMMHNVTLPSIAPPQARTFPDVVLRPGPVGRPAGFGVVVDANRSVLTHASALEGRSTLQVQTAAGESVGAEVIAYEAATGLAMLRLSGDGVLPPVPISGARPEPGSLAATAARWNGRDIVAPVFVTSSGPEAYSIDAHGAALGGIALYNLEGQAFAIAGAPNQGTAFPLRDAVVRFTARIASGRFLDASIGVMFQPLTGPLTSVFGGAGALVSRAIAGGAAEAAGLVHGDVIVRVAETPVDSPEAAQQAIAALAPAAQAAIEVRRNSKPITVQVVPQSALDGRPRRAAEVPPNSSGVRADTFLSAAILQHAGIAPDALVLEVAGRRVSSRADALREWGRSRKPALLYLELQNERFFAVAGETT
jgi:S1-C subfamily serine protease